MPKMLKMLIFIIVCGVIQLLFFSLAKNLDINSFSSFVFMVILYLLYVSGSLVLARDISNFFIVSLPKGTAVLDKDSKQILRVFDKPIDLFSWDQQIKDKELFEFLQIDIKNIVVESTQKSLSIFPDGEIEEESRTIEKIEFDFSVVSKTDDESILKRYNQKISDHKKFIVKILKKFNENKDLDFVNDFLKYSDGEQKRFCEVFAQKLNPELESVGLEVKSARFRRFEPSYF